MLNHELQKVHFASPEGETSARACNGPAQWGQTYEPDLGESRSGRFAAGGERVMFPVVADQPIAPPKTTKTVLMKLPNIRKTRGGDPKESNDGTQSEIKTVNPMPANANPNTPRISRSMLNGFWLLEGMTESINANQAFTTASSCPPRSVIRRSCGIDDALLQNFRSGPLAARACFRI